MEQVMPDFITYLTNERNASKSTVSSYCRDLERMFQFLDGKGIKKTDDVTPISLNSYILYLEKEGFSISTVSNGTGILNWSLFILNPEPLLCGLEKTNFI